MTRFVIHEHWASHHHFDLRIEKNGKLVDWAIPKGIPLSYNKKVLAIKQPNHNIKWLNFEGEIKDGYGAGKMKVWDKGTYDIIKWGRENLILNFKGKKVKGVYILHKFDKLKWWFFKSKKTSSELKETKNILNNWRFKNKMKLKDLAKKVLFEDDVETAEREVMYNEIMQPINLADKFKDRIERCFSACSKSSDGETKCFILCKIGVEKAKLALLDKYIEFMKRENLVQTNKFTNIMNLRQNVLNTIAELEKQILNNENE